MDNIDQLKKLAQIFNTDKIISKEEIDGILAAIVQILANNKRSVDETVASTQRELENTLDTIITKHNEIIQSVGETTRTTKDELTTKLEAELAKALAKVDDLVAEARSVMPENGKDADPEEVATIVLARLPEQKDFILSKEEVANRISELDEDEKELLFTNLGSKKLTSLQEGFEERLADAINRVRLTRGIKDIVAGTNVTVSKDDNGVVTVSATGGSGSGITSINADTTAAQLLTVGTSGTDFAISDNGTGTHTFNLPTASATNRGALSSADWTTFNNKQSAITPAALTKTDDTNVTLTLGGSPSTSLLSATSLTLGWTGQLGVSRGGTGVSAISALSIWVANSANTITEVTPSAGQSVRINAGGTAWEAYTPSSGGVPAGSDTQLQYNNAGAFGGITGATTNGTVVTLTSPVIATSQTNSYATASTIGIFDGSKNLISADTATYPSLTELSYVKGVTSSIQTQLNAKGDALTTNPLSQFAATTSAQLRGVISDETGSGLLVFATSPTFTTSIAVNGAAGTSRNLNLTTAGASRWELSVNATAESGTNAGSDFAINAYNDAGAYLYSPIIITRSTGVVTLSSALPVASGGTGQTSYTNGQLLIGNTTGNTLTKATLTGTADQVNISNGAGSITLSLPQSIATTSTPQFAKLGVGTAADANRLLLVSGDVSGGVATLNRNNASTNAAVGTVIIKGTSTGDMVDGFGAAFQFAIQDTAAVENIIADIRGVRNGSDTTGKLVFGIANAGSPAAELELTAAALSPSVSDGLALGTTILQYSDIFLAEGGVINWDNGDATLTQVGDVVTLAGADLKVTTAGNASTSVITTDATQTLTNKTLTSPTLTTPSAFTTGGTITLAENTSIALDPAGSADGKYTGITITGTAGYTQAFGDLVYLDPTDSRWEAADANSAAGADGDARGMLAMVVSAGTDGTACTLLLQGVIRADAKFPTFTVNNPIYVSETAGSVTQTQPTTTDVVIRIVGAALTADEMYFNPDWSWITHT